ncbi:hypothetical protein GCM10010915_23470 [Microbacterium faecale]|uniref:Zeta toxin domain-containing protein n=1 Tax=Microbacterium faecale TaxID=1804630 RepID=A0A916YE27_9MICO|nr:hypothetical protein GCM10010915_23470 [Microbacterium faecale]
MPYIDLSARFALDNGLDVVIEGILHSESYGEMLTQLRKDHAGLTRCYYFELDLEETLDRHRTKALAAEVSEAVVASWYRSADRVVGLEESVFDATVSAADALQQVLADARWSETLDIGS